MSILKKMVFPICLASLLCMEATSVSAVEISEANDSLNTVSVAAFSEVSATIENNVCSQATANFSVSSSNGTVGDNVDINITADGETAFVSATFALHYDQSKLKYLNYSIPAGSELNSGNLAQVENNGNGVVYLVLSESSENIKFANITFTFELIAAGESTLTLTTDDMFDADDTEVAFNSSSGKITATEKVTEPITTTTTETTTETTTTEVEKPTQVTTTVSNTEKPTQGTTTVSNTEKPTQGTTTVSNTEKPTQGTTTVADTEKPTQGTSTTKNNNSNTATTTAKPTNNSASTTNASKDNVPDTGDNFPFASLVATLIGSSVIAVKARRSTKK